MFRPILSAIAVVPILAAFASGCGGSGGDSPITEDAARQALPLMTLQREDVPVGLASLGDEFSTNVDAVSGLGGGPTLQELEGWGRVLGYKIDYQAQEPANATAITVISTSVSLYQTSDGAADSLADREDDAKRTDWRSAHSAFQEFEQQEVTRDLPVEQLLWLRFSGYQELSPGVRNLVFDDQIIFRVRQAWGFLGVVSTAVEGERDRNSLMPEIEVLVKKQIQHINEAYDAGLLGQ